MRLGKIALEEHVVLPALSTPGAAGSSPDVNDVDYFADVRRRLADVDLRLADMDRCGVDTMVLSLSQPGIQAIPDARTNGSTQAIRCSWARPGASASKPPRMHCG